MNTYQCGECLEYNNNGELYPALVKTEKNRGGHWFLLCLPCLRQFQEENRIVTTLKSEPQTKREIELEIERLR